MMRFLLIAMTAAIPTLVRADSLAGSGCASSFSTIPCLAQAAGNLFGLATAALIGVGLIMYFWGIVQKLFKAGSGNATSFDDIRTQLGWGLIALFIVFSVWGIIALLGNTLFGTNNFNSLW